jgi:hypothetical protein
LIIFPELLDLGYSWLSCLVLLAYVGMEVTDDRDANRSPAIPDHCPDPRVREYTPSSALVCIYASTPRILLITPRISLLVLVTGDACGG